MAIESRTAFKINEGQSGPEEQSGEPFLVEPPTVMNVTAAFMDMPKEVKANVEKARSETVAKLWRVTEQMNILYPENWTRIAAQELATFQETMVNVLVKEWQKTVKTRQGIQRAEYKPSIPSREPSKSIETIKKDTTNVKNTQCL